MGLGGQRHVPAALPPGNRLGTHCIGGSVGPRIGLDGPGESRPHPPSWIRPGLIDSLYVPKYAGQYCQLIFLCFRAVFT